MIAKQVHPSPAVEDYVKAIFAITSGTVESASTTEIAAGLGVTTASVSSMLKKLDQDGLVEHARYRGVRLTPPGEQLALRVVRRHRLIELFLTQILDIPWERVHAEAEILEHAVSDYLVEAIAHKLGDPEVDPHGDPIPGRDLTLATTSAVTLASLGIGQPGTLVRVDDSDPAMLRYLSEHGIALGDMLKVVRREPFGGPVVVQTAATELALGSKLAEAMHVEIT